MTKPTAVGRSLSMAFHRVSNGEAGDEQSRAPVPLWHLSGLGWIAPGALTQPQLGMQPHQASLRTHIHPVPLNSIPNDAFAAVSSTGASQEAQDTGAGPFVLETPLTVGDVNSTVERASDVFWQRLVNGDWVGAGDVLQIFGEKLSLMKATAHAGVPRSQAIRIPSEREKAALKKMKELPVVCGAHLMGSCHYIDQDAYGSGWSSGLRFQWVGAIASMDEVVAHYQQHFDIPESRAMAFRGALIHLSWLTPKWEVRKMKTRRTHEQRLESALQKLSHGLVSAHEKLKLEPEPQKIFREELFSALKPAYCSPLLAPELKGLEGFQLCGDGLAQRLRDIENGKGWRLFPITPSRGAGKKWQTTRLTKPSATTAPEPPTGTAMKRPLDSEPVEQVGADQPRQRLRLSPKVEATPLSPIRDTFSNNNSNNNSSFEMQESTLQSTHGVMPLPPQSFFMGSALQFQISAHKPVPAMPMGPPDPLAADTWRRLARQQNMQDRETFPPRAEAGFPETARPQPLGP